MGMSRSKLSLNVWRVWSVTGTFHLLGQTTVHSNFHNYVLENRKLSSKGIKWKTVRRIHVMNKEDIVVLNEHRDDRLDTLYSYKAFFPSILGKDYCLCHGIGSSSYYKKKKKKEKRRRTLNLETLLFFIARRTLKNAESCSGNANYVWLSNLIHCAVTHVT